jgi:hypothetical protein
MRGVLDGMQQGACQKLNRKYVETTTRKSSIGIYELVRNLEKVEKESSD